jgi:hypothetical protein
MTPEKFAELIKTHSFEGDITITDGMDFFLLEDVVVLDNIVELKIKKDGE